MQIESVIIDNIHFIHFIMFNISSLFHYNFFLIWPAEIGARLIYPYVLYAVKYGSWLWVDF